MTSFNNFADLASFVAASRENDGLTQTYEGAFIEHSEMAKLSIVEAPEALDMPDPEQVRAATEMMMQTMFDVLRDTRMEPFAADLAWGFANSFHVVAKRIEGREDDAAKKLGDLARSYDPSEIYATELEDTQLLCQTLQGCREAMECMRDHAAEVYRVETGKPFSPVRGSRVSSALTASMIEARDYLASKARERREQFAPEGPVVAFSGGQVWEDVDLLWNGLDSIKARIPEMILATTAQAKGCDAVAHAWAASRGVKVIQFRLDRSQGMLVRLTSFTGDMYENQFVYSLKIRVAAANLLMLHSLSQEAVGPLDRHRNSSFVNNFETLDIAHYMIGEAIPGRPMSTRRVPMNVSQLELAKLSDVAATLSTTALATSRMRRLAAKVTQALNTVERGYFRHVSIATHSKPENRLYRRLLTALDWFRQSFSARANEAEAIVALAVAFETLLTDQYAPAIAERLRRRIGICIKGVPGVANYQASVLAIYYARSAIVHTGEPDHAIDIHRGQVAFARCFCAIAERLTAWTPTSNNAMGDLLGDIA